MTTVVIPTLMSDINRIKHPTDIIKYILNWYMRVPKNINDTFSEHEISFRYTDAANNSDKTLMKTAVANDIRSVLDRYFPSAINLDVSVDTEDIDDVRYNIIISIRVVIDTGTYSVSSNFKVDKERHLVIEFSNS